MSASSPASRRSWGSRLLPAGLHRRLQFERFPVQDFVEREALPHLRPGIRALNAGSGSEEEEDFRAALRDSGAVIHRCDIAHRAGLDFQADLHAVPARDRTYDLVLCTQVLEHVRNPAAVCRELARVLKPGGRLFLTAPQSAFLHEIPHHYFNFTCYGLRLLLEDAGLEMVKMEPQGGHFLCLGWQLHYTSVVIGRRMTTPMKRALWWPWMLLSRAVFGFLAKLACLWLDRFDPEPRNTMGWNVHCRKPGAE